MPHSGHSAAMQWSDLSSTADQLLCFTIRFRINSGLVSSTPQRQWHWSQHNAIDTQCIGPVYVQMALLGLSLTLRDQYQPNPRVIAESTTHSTHRLSTDSWPHRYTNDLSKSNKTSRLAVAKNYQTAESFDMDFK